MKCQLFKELGVMVQCRKWANFLPTINHELHMEMRTISGMPKNYLDESLISVIKAILTLVQTVCEPKERKDHFKWLFYEMVLNSWEKSPVYYIRRAMEKYFIDLDDVLPFLQFFIKECSSDEAATLLTENCALKNTTEDPDVLLENIFVAMVTIDMKKKSMESFKNSILINAHFKNSFIAK